MAAINNKDTEEVIEQKVAEAETKEKKPKAKPAADYMDEFIREESRIRGWSMETLIMVRSFKNHLLKFKNLAWFLRWAVLNEEEKKKQEEAFKEK